MNTKRQPMAKKDIDRVKGKIEELIKIKTQALASMRIKTQNSKKRYGV